MDTQSKDLATERSEIYHYKKKLSGFRADEETGIKPNICTTLRQNTTRDIVYLKL